MWLHLIEHVLIDTLKVFVVVLLLYFVLSFFENKLARKFEKSDKYSPIIGASLGMIPQCGFSIVASDLYKKKHISTGTLLAVFIACSDEALIILLAHPNKILSIIPLFVLKFILALAFGYLIDFLIKNKEIILKRIHHNHGHLLVHKGCCHHEIDEESESFVKAHIIHPLIHSLKIGAYILIINFIFALLIEFIGEDNIKTFLTTNIYLTPLLSSLIGLIPNCASSVIISELFANNILSFSATLSGLISNAGLGLIYLLKDKNNIKRNLLITLTLFIIALIVGYISIIIEVNII